MKREYAELPPSEISTAGFNPEKRTTTEALRDLLADIREVGILSPCTVKSIEHPDNGYRYIMADGHRRLAVAKQLGLEAVPCYIDNSDLTIQELFRRLNATRKNIMPAGWLQVYVAGGSLPPGNTMRRVKRLEEVLGKKGLKKLASEGHSPFVIDQATKASRYCFDKVDDKFIRSFIDWLVKHNQTYAVRKFMEVGGKASALIACVRQDRPLPTPRYE